MIGKTGLAADHYITPQRRAARNSYLCHQHVVFSHHHVVRDLHEVVDLGALLDEGIAEGGAIHRYIGA